MENNSSRLPQDQAEKALLEKSQQGDSVAFGQLFKLHYARVYRIIYGILLDEEESKEAAQRTWIKVWDNLHRYNYQSAFTTWLHRVAVNTAIDESRRKNRYWNRIKEVFTFGPAERSGAEESVLPPDDRTPADALLTKDRKLRLDRALARLPQPQREVFTLREFENFSYEEIADTLSIKTGTVMSRLHLARKKLQSILTKDPL